MEKETKKIREMLYSGECPLGRIFTDGDEYFKALEDGWAEAPEDIGKDPEELKKLRETQVPVVELDLTKKQLKNADKERIALTQRCSDLVEENTKLRREVSELSKDLEDNQKVIRDLDTENKQAIEKIKTVEVEKKELTDKVKDLEKDLEKAKKK